ncbi:MAG: type I polyketide synthase, partial [Deltaproteobacteria bacterium]|nr:type I polyketide synthase [Deltaproteobacteria bacterium]
VRDNKRIYAVIKGIGSASGSGIETSIPDAETYRIALKRACEDAGADPDSISYVETHGSGCPEEDTMEATALLDVFPSGHGKAPSPFGSVKADIGHTGAASGIASLVKLCVCLDQEIIPPVRYPVDKISGLRIHGTGLFSPTAPQYWIRNRDQGPRRASLSCFSAAGTCTNVILEDVKEQEKSSGHIDIPHRTPKDAGLFAIEADHVSGILEGLERLRSIILVSPERGISSLAKIWWDKHPADPGKTLCLSITPQNSKDLLSHIDYAKQSLTVDPSPITPMPNVPVSFSPRPLGRSGKVAFVFPGSGNHFVGMGQGLSVQWPDIFRRQDKRNGYLKDQFLPDLFWNIGSNESDNMNPQAAILGQVTLGTVVSDLIRSFGVRPDAAIGYSLGESAALFSLNAWTERDEMLNRMNASPLFTHDLAGPCNAARETWKLEENEDVDWVSGVLNCPENVVKKALKGREKVYLLIVNTLTECVVGGNRKAVEELVKTLGCLFFPLSDVTTVHCEVARVVEKPYRDLHLFKATPPDITFYSCAWARAYDVDTESAADSILAQALRPINFPEVINAAYKDGSRMFLEMGPGNSCSRMITSILEDSPHMAMSACYAGQDDVAAVLRLLGQLLSERVPIDLGTLYSGETLTFESPGTQHPASLIIPVGGKPFRMPKPTISETENRR